MGMIAVAFAAWIYAGSPAPGAEAAAARAEPPLVATTFFYWYRHDTKEHFVNADGSDALTDHPPIPEKVSYASADWWYAQLLLVKKAGIDAILPVYWGFPGDGGGWSKTGLAALARAEERLAREGKGPVPAGMFYDTSTLAWNTGNRRIDIAAPEGERFFIRTILEFFALVPREFRLLRDGRPVVFLYSAGFHKGDNPNLFARTRAAFREEFGSDIYLVKEVSWPYPADACYAWGGALGLKLHQVASLGPGYDHSAVPGREPLVVPRENGEFYRRQWERLLALAPARRPAIVHVETWNEYHEGTDVGPSTEYGATYMELTAKYADLFRRGERIAVRGRWREAAKVSWKSGAAGGIRIPSLGDGIVDKAVIDGVACLKTAPNRHGPARYFYCDLDDSFVYDAGEERFAVTMTLRVGRAAPVQVEYDSADPKGSVFEGAFKPGPALGPLAAEAWHTVRFELSDARFANRANGADFRLSAGGADLAVAEITVEKR
ncbi:MAG TPA: DUF5010 domain-containing protein [Planctomycetota bacterium]|jgi:hypothetical protein|nr:DUF5010 domain-containing protein [Planctomycetota bacterium]OQC20484.1 MAG: hypothetical protein BWX69_01829 [Planctomycetes bacterium ADurb.Bin069]HNR99044.1 DUF5010 domain-containing protein [Planctomycetota bacterium]HNU26263.1 DUF5010 domain-containing protein [Planctomycetota bacterium]HOE31472.1 DUF5010 domain-containing protein [Planctomycetota bacterium]